MKDRQLVPTHREGVRYLELRQFYPVSAWGNDGGGICHGLELTDSGDMEHLDITVETANSGVFSNSSEHKVGLRLPAAQADLLIAKLTEIREHQLRQKAEQEEWERQREAG